MLMHTSDERFASYAHLLEASGDMNKLPDWNKPRHDQSGDVIMVLN